MCCLCVRVLCVVCCEWKKGREKRRLQEKMCACSRVFAKSAHTHKHRHLHTFYRPISFPFTSRHSTNTTTTLALGCSSSNNRNRHKTLAPNLKRPPPPHQSSHTHTHTYYTRMAIFGRPFLPIVARVVPACMLIGAGMELFMLKTGFCTCVRVYVCIHMHVYVVACLSVSILSSPLTYIHRRRGPPQGS